MSIVKKTQIVPREPGDEKETREQSAVYDRSEDWLSISHQGESISMHRSNWYKLCDLVTATILEARPEEVEQPICESASLEDDIREVYIRIFGAATYSSLLCSAIDSEGWLIKKSLPDYSFNLMPSEVPLMDFRNGNDEFRPKELASLQELIEREKRKNETAETDEKSERKETLGRCVTEQGHDFFTVTVENKSKTFYGSAGHYIDLYVNSFPLASEEHSRFLRWLWEVAKSFE